MTALFGRKGRGFPFGAAVESLLGGSLNGLVVKTGCPFVSGAGLELLVKPLTALPAWQAATKQWLIGVHHGITEPAALRTLLKMPGSQVRLFTGQVTLSAKSLCACPQFHAKVTGIEKKAGGKRGLKGLIVGSANLTRAALGSDPPVNFEAGASLKISSEVERAAWRAWWKAAWDQSLPLTEQLITRYEKLRAPFLRRNRMVEDLLDPPSETLVSEADMIWIEAGDMSGGSRNQVEFNLELAPFFGPPMKGTRLLTIKWGKNKQRHDRTLSYKLTTYGRHIWRLSLPTSTQGGPVYPGRIIRLERDAVPRTFHLDVANATSPKARGWRAASTREGYLGRTSKNRAFGLS